MASSYWIKAYYEILDDPKMGRLSDHIWRRAIEFFLLAGEAGNGGYLPSLSDMAWRLRATDDDVLDCLEALQKVDVVNETDNGWMVTHFAERQDAPSNAERQARYRERKQKRDYYSNEPRYENVTNCNVDNEEDKDKDKEEKKIPTLPPPSGDWYMRVFSGVTGMAAIPGNEVDKVIAALDGLYAQHRRNEAALTEYLRPYWEKWLTTKGKNGQPYKRTNCAWLYEWAVAGELPGDNPKPQYAEVF